MKEIKVGTKCPKCNTDIVVGTEINDAMLAPVVRGKVTPVETIQVYKISSEELKQFIIQKARKYVPDINVEVVPRYCEKKRRKESDPHRSYASLRIGFSNHAIEKNEDNGWFGKIGEGSDYVRVVNSLFNELVQRYKYDKKQIDAWLKSYKTLEELEEGLGMTEAYINDLRMYSIPKRVRTNTKEDWVIFSAAPENVLKDFLTEVSTNKLPGRMEIKDVYPISKDIVEWTIHMHPADTRLKEDPHVRQILLGEEKAKK